MNMRFFYAAVFSLTALLTASQARAQPWTANDGMTGTWSSYSVSAVSACRPGLGRHRHLRHLGTPGWQSRRHLRSARPTRQTLANGRAADCGSGPWRSVSVDMPAQYGRRRLWLSPPPSARSFLPLMRSTPHFWRSALHRQRRCHANADGGSRRRRPTRRLRELQNDGLSIYARLKNERASAWPCARRANHVRSLTSALFAQPIRR